MKRILVILVMVAAMLGGMSTAHAATDISDKQLIAMGYVKQKDGSFTREAPKPVQAVKPVCVKPYGPDILVCGGKMYDAMTGKTLQAPKLMRTVSGKVYADPTARKVRICEPRKWTTHCATRTPGKYTPIFITGKRKGDFLVMHGFKLVYYGDTGMFVRR